MSEAMVKGAVLQKSFSNCKSGSLITKEVVLTYYRALDQQPKMGANADFIISS
jgi:hypothetical protein